MGYGQDFINQCKQEGVDRRVWLVIDDQIFIASDPIANHEDLFNLVAETGVSLVGFDWRVAAQGDIMNAVARGAKDALAGPASQAWLGRVQAEFDAMLNAGLAFELLGPDERSEKALV